MCWNCKIWMSWSMELISWSNSAYTQWSRAYMYNDKKMGWRWYHFDFFLSPDRFCYVDNQATFLWKLAGIPHICCFADIFSLICHGALIVGMACWFVLFPGITSHRISPAISMCLLRKQSMIIGFSESVPVYFYRWLSWDSLFPIISYLVS